jgi:uncharacterized ferritin-like protein (DUF455 family)
MPPAPHVWPAPNTLERAAWNYVTTTSLADKLAGPSMARSFERNAPARRVQAPGRPRELTIATRGLRTRNATVSALRSAGRRAQLFHTFLHHELQAAELMCWAVLAFPETPPSFRRGLMAICRDEVRHMRMYRDHMRALDCEYGDHPVRDWFWERVPSCRTPAEFVATMGIGFEGGNLDHAARFAQRLRAAGDPQAASIEELVGAEEEAHVRFAMRWFQRFTGANDFTTWMASLPAPLSPLVMRGEPIAMHARRRAGLSDAFVADLRRWHATS